ncbi:MAG TPA: hypothetical protein QF644_00365 [Candidatus Poseidoniaceae archaeon]|nr:hypothetical protein [Candidatus Poseidoniaceae archaeon]
MSTVGTGLMTALMMVVSSVFGVAAIDGIDAFTEERTVPQEKLDKATHHIVNELMLIDACLAIEECALDSVELEEKKVVLLEKLEVISAYTLDPINNEKPHLKHGKKIREKDSIEKLSFEEHISNKIIKLNNDLMMIDACEIVEECDIHEDILNKKESKINRGLEKLNYCSENFEECESKKIHKMKKRSHRNK